MNWGNKLLMVFLVFAAGMGYLIYRSVNTNFDLVEKDYYATELRYQQVIDDTKRADALSKPVDVIQSSEGISLRFPEEMKGRKLEGTIWFYCAYDRNNDRKFKVEVNKEGIQLLANTALPSGSFTVKISWKDQQTGYYSEKYISIL